MNSALLILIERFESLIVGNFNYSRRREAGSARPKDAKTVTKLPKGAVLVEQDEIAHEFVGLRPTSTTYNHLIKDYSSD